MEVGSLIGLAAAQEAGEDAFRKLEQVLASVESNRGAVHVLGSDEAIKQIDPLGGIVALKRW